MEFPKTDLEFEKAWSYAAGSLSEINTVVYTLSQEAGKYFISGKDTEAKVLRDLARILQTRADKLSHEAEDFVYEASNRKSKNDTTRAG